MAMAPMGLMIAHRWRCPGFTPYNLRQSFWYADLPNCLKQLELNVTQPDEECTRCQSTS